ALNYVVVTADYDAARHALIHPISRDQVARPGASEGLTNGGEMGARRDAKDGIRQALGACDVAANEIAFEYVAGAVRIPANPIRVIARDDVACPKSSATDKVVAVVVEADSGIAVAQGVSPSHVCTDEIALHYRLTPEQEDAITAFAGGPDRE